MPIAGLQLRYQRIPLALRMRGLQVLPAHQVHGHVGVIEPLELQRDAHAVRG